MREIGVRTRIAFCCVAVVCLLTGCTFDNEETLFAGVNCKEPSVPLTYENFVMPLLQRRCVSCHSSFLASGGVRLDNYSNVSVYVGNGSLLGAIRHAPGFVPMPQGEAKLPDCDIKSIAAWIENGYPEK